MINSTSKTQIYTGWLCPKGKKTHGKINCNLKSIKSILKELLHICAHEVAVA